MQILLGGLITLAVTAVVQILIIPWVQRRNRARERWEDAVVEYTTLLETDLPDALQAVFDVGYHYRDAVANQGRAADIQDDAMKAWTHYSKIISREVHLRGRVMRVSRRAPFWADMQARLNAMEMAIEQFSLRSDADIMRARAASAPPLPFSVGQSGASTQSPPILKSDLDDLHRFHGSAAQARLDAANMMLKIEKTMKPPRQRIRDLLFSLDQVRKY